MSIRDAKEDDLQAMAEVTAAAFQDEERECLAVKEGLRLTFEQYSVD